MFLAKTPRIVVFGLSTFVALCCLAPDGLASEPLPSAKAPAKIKAWHLLLESSANGKYDFLLAPQGVRLSNKSFDITLVAKAPQWRFYAIRESAKEIASCTLAQFKTMVVPSFTMAGITQELKTPARLCLLSTKINCRPLDIFLQLRAPANSSGRAAKEREQQSMLSKSRVSDSR
jgi:hypothetical protein